MKPICTFFFILLLNNVFCQTSHTVVFVKNAQAVKRYLIKTSNDADREKIFWYPGLKGFHFCGSTPGTHLARVPAGYVVSNIPSQCSDDPWPRVSMLMSADTLETILRLVPDQELVYANNTIIVKESNNMELHIPLTTGQDFAFLQTHANRGRSPEYNPIYTANVVLPIIRFDFQNSGLRSEDYPILDYVANNLKINAAAKIILEGYASGDEGTDIETNTLARDRANAIKTYLVNSGIAAERFTIKAYGETKPLASEATEEGRITNRRAEIKY